MDDCGIREESGPIGDREIWSAVGVELLEGPRFDVGGCASETRMTIEGLDDKVVTNDGFAGADFFTAHWVSVEAKGNFDVAEGTGSSGRNAGDGDSQTKVTKKAKVTIRKRGVRRGRKCIEEASNVWTIERLESSAM